MPNHYVSARSLQRSYASLKAKDALLVIMDRSTPQAIMVPFDDETFRLLDERARRREEERAEYGKILGDTEKSGGHSSEEVRAFLKRSITAKPKKKAK